LDVGIWYAGSGMVESPDPDPVWFQLLGGVGSRLGMRMLMVKWRNDEVVGILEM
jgi:hypothetical protein